MEQIPKLPQWREPVLPTRRRKMDKKRAERITKANGSVCYICGSGDGPFDIEHPDQLWMGGSDDDKDLRPVCRFTCHKVKSKKDAGDRAKVRSLQRPKKPSRMKSRPFEKPKVKQKIRSQGFRKRVKR